MLCSKKKKVFQTELKCGPFTLQTVAHSEQVHEDHFARSNGEKSDGPRKTQEDRDAGHGPQVLSGAATVGGRLVGSDLPDLDQNHDKDGDVAQRDQEDRHHHRSVEDNFVLQPAAEMVKRSG